jgi:hypothetical protein
VVGDCNLNGVLDDCDIDDETSLDCNENGIPDECELVDNDCNENGAPDECDIASGESEDCDGNATPDECQVIGTTTYRLAQESEAGAGDFDGNVLGFLEPYETTLSAEGFYRYALGFDASFNGPTLELTDDRSHLLLANNTDGLSLVVVHDRPQDGDGGNADTRYEVSGDSDGLVISVMDDPTNIGDSYTGNPGDSTFTAVHAWSACCTDGLALTGLSDEWSITMEFTSQVTGLDTWAAYSPGQAPVMMDLVTGRRIRIDLVAQPPEGDCNANGIPDECDIADGTSQDLNENGIPDECEDV